MKKFHEVPAVRFEFFNSGSRSRPGVSGTR